MPIDYLADCKTNSSKMKFGICDKQSPSTHPAYIDEDNSSEWIGIINNTTEKNIQFNAIDNCIDIRREDGKMDSRCDGVISYEKNLIFVELKERERWTMVQKRKRTIDSYNK